MDDRRFDNAVRSLASQRSRRRLVSGLLGGGLAMVVAHLRLPNTEARQGYSAQGEACYDDDQCLAADTPLVCAWNGYGSAGAACCAASGGRCADEFGCCGPASCYLGTCVDLSSPSAGEACWQLAGDPDPCAYGQGLVCIHDDTGSVWGTCQSLYTGASDPSAGSGTACTWEGCTCVLYRDPECRASCPLYDPCDTGLACTGTSEDIGTCVAA